MIAVSQRPCRGGRVSIALAVVLALHAGSCWAFGLSLPSDEDESSPIPKAKAGVAEVATREPLAGTWKAVEPSKKVEASRSPALLREERGPPTRDHS